jgi:hypothetical protein
MTDAGPHLNRRAALLAFAAVAAAPLGLSRAMAAPARGGHVYRLDPVHRPGAGKSTSSCTGCTACRHHARNKLFATSKAADRVRAHKGCKCKVVRAAPVSPATYEALFGSPGNLKQVSVDRRDPEVRAILLKDSKRETRTPRRPEAKAAVAARKKS